MAVPHVIRGTAFIISLGRIKGTMFARVALPVPFNEFFTYRVPDGIAETLAPGMLAIVPFRKSAVTGVVLSLESESDTALEEVREISALGDPELMVPLEIMQLAQFASRRYVTTPGMVLKSALPPGTMSYRKMYFYPGVSASTADISSKARDFVNQITISPGKSSYADLKRLGPGERDEIDGLIRTGVLAVSPFKAEGEYYRGKEKWVNAIQARLPESLRKTIRSAILFDALLENPDGLRVSALKELGFSARSAATLVRKGAAEFVYKMKELSEIGSMKSLPREDAIELNLWQQSALERVVASLGRNEKKSFLLYGVTSSGKTQVYLEAASRVLDAGGSILVLVPEISLTPQIIARFQRFLKTTPSIWHSRLSQTERLIIYKNSNLGKSRLVIGTRSAIFAPLRNLRLIVVDEEQDHSYKQDDPAPRYSARDIALERARFSNAVVILGSATPSAESYYLSRIGQLQLLTLPQRVAGPGNPKIEIISTAFKPEPRPSEPPIFPKGFRPITEKLYNEISIRIKNREQVILLLNRRGYSSAVVCFECGWVGKCPDCEIGWTYHKTGDRMICHYCGRDSRGLNACQQCGSSRLSFRSAGTERLEETLKKILPAARTVRLDTDAAAGKWEARDILDDFGKGKYDILLGTQMVAKGHHFPRVSLVGVVGADVGLSLPDFRATERVLQLLTQAAGRAGRSSRKKDLGLVMIQTVAPENPIFRYLISNDFPGFLEDELKIRMALGYPPYKRLVLIVVLSTSAVKCAKSAAEFKDEILLATADRKIDILGPVESPVFKRGKLYRYQLLLKIPLEIEPSELLRTVDDFIKRLRGVNVRIDVDPVSFM